MYFDKEILYSDAGTNFNKIPVVSVVLQEMKTSMHFPVHRLHYSAIEIQRRMRGHRVRFASSAHLPRHTQAAPKMVFCCLRHLLSCSVVCFSLSSLQPLLCMQASVLEKVGTAEMTMISKFLDMKLRIPDEVSREALTFEEFCVIRLQKMARRKRQLKYQSMMVILL